MNVATKVFLLLNGEPPKCLPELTNYQYICATDGGHHFLGQQKIIPDLITGDFDSATVLPKNTEVIHTPNQEFTDFEKALQILHKRGYFLIDIFGASGKEQDHFLGNLEVALRWKNKLKLTFFDNYGTYFLISKTTVLQQVIGKTVSLIPFPKATCVTTEGLQYRLQKEGLTLGKRIGTRNKAIENTVKISFETGELFVFVNNPQLAIVE